MIDLLKACSDNQPFDISKHKDPLIELAAQSVFLKSYSYRFLQTFCHPDLEEAAYPLFPSCIVQTLLKAPFYTYKQLYKKTMIG